MSDWDTGTSTGNPGTGGVVTVSVTLTRLDLRQC